LQELQILAVVEEELVVVQMLLAMVMPEAQGL
jgi:hypothetical protein